MQKLSLPIPAHEALAASEALTQQLRAAVAEQGWIPFSQFMEKLLYTPQLGYYSGGATKLGKDGDFTTAPEISPLFGGTLARLYASLLPAIAPEVMEFGAGTGKLAKDFLTECRAAGIAVRRYAIVDLSGELQARQRETLAAFPEVVWLDQMPEAFSGLVLGNEVLDAMPVNLVQRDNGVWRERGVALAEDGAFCWQNGPQVPAEWLEQMSDHDQLPDGYLTELHPVACGFMRSLSQMLINGQQQTGSHGVAVLIDYGFPEREYYHPERDQGTLMCHYRHHAHPEPFYLPGLQDVTAHVDFTAMAVAASQQGAQVQFYNSQAAFLLGAGITDLLSRTSAEDALSYLPQSQALQKLTSPAEMGELFKVLIIGTGADLPPLLQLQDRSHRL